MNAPTGDASPAKRSYVPATCSPRLAGFQLVVDSERRVIIGATFTGPTMQEPLHSATIAIIGEVPLERLRQAVPSFPTVSEVWLYLLEQLEL
ncbi:hypothetical protein ACRYCC_42855 [Actinomadura scrupuli]|uniref:hypothetical protein n=1 Tax=Actinomadura scrupuli TaxID=559629 RepID=UPI003D977775